jgi:hypothetical protein
MRTKLTAQDVCRILQLRRLGMPYKEIGLYFDINGVTARSICLGISWREIGDRTNLPTNVGKPGSYSRLTEFEVREIIRLRSAGWKLRDIALRFGLTKSGVCRICAGNRWGILS